MHKSIKLAVVTSIAVLNLIYGVGYAAAQSDPSSKESKTTIIPGTAPASSRGLYQPSIDEKSETSESSSSRVRVPLEPAEADPTTAHEIFEDFLNGSNYTPLEKINQLAAPGGGSGQGWFPGQVYEDAWGVIEANHGTGPNSRLDLVGKTHNMYNVAVGIGTAYEYQTRFNFANLSNETNRYIAFDGFFDSDTTDPVFYRGILFRYSDNINDGRFQIVVREAEGVETLVDTGVTPVVNTWYRVKICINAAGTEAQFYINGVQVGVVTTNLAIGTANRYTVESNTDRLSGNTNFVSRRYDYVRFRAVSGRASRL